MSDKENSPNYAPNSFIKEKEAAGLRKTELASAMRNLFAVCKIHVEAYGRPSRPYSRLRLGNGGPQTAAV